MHGVRFKTVSCDNPQMSPSGMHSTSCLTRHRSCRICLLWQQVECVYGTRNRCSPCYLPLSRTHTCKLARLWQKRNCCALLAGILPLLVVDGTTLIDSIQGIYQYARSHVCMWPQSRINRLCTFLWRCVHNQHMVFNYDSTPAALLLYHTGASAGFRAN